ncbi:MAG: ATP-binding protein [Limisphaerales bacterium]
MFEESLAADGNPVFTREAAQVHLAKTEVEKEAKFLIDWHLAALPIVQERTRKDPLFIFKQWLARVVVLRPIPSLIKGTSEQETLQPNIQGTDFGAWFSGVVAFAPAAYEKIDRYLKQVMPDLKDIRNPMIGKDARSLEVQFSNDLGNVTIPFADLSDGEKCFMICAMVLAANDAYGPLVCFWDEPDNYLALSEVGHFVMALRKAFQSGGQFITTSHNPEAIRRFSEENTLALYRKSHLEPTNVRPLSGIKVNGDLVSALIRGDVELLASLNACGGKFARFCFPNKRGRVFGYLVSSLCFSEQLIILHANRRPISRFTPQIRARHHALIMSLQGMLFSPELSPKKKTLSV